MRGPILKTWWGAPEKHPHLSSDHHTYRYEHSHASTHTHIQINQTHTQTYTSYSCRSSLLSLSIRPFPMSAQPLSVLSISISLNTQNVNYSTHTQVQTLVNGCPSKTACLLQVTIAVTTSMERPQWPSGLKDIKNSLYVLVSRSSYCIYTN